MYIIYIYTHVSMCVYIYIYIYIYDTCTFGGRVSFARAHDSICHMSYVICMCIMTHPLYTRLTITVHMQHMHTSTPMSMNTAIHITVNNSSCALTHLCFRCSYSHACKSSVRSRAVSS